MKECYVVKNAVHWEGQSASVCKTFYLKISLCYYFASECSVSGCMSLLFFFWSGQNLVQTTLHINIERENLKVIIPFGQQAFQFHLKQVHNGYSGCFWVSHPLTQEETTFGLFQGSAFEVDWLHFLVIYKMAILLVLKSKMWSSLRPEVFKWP